MMGTAEGSGGSRGASGAGNINVESSWLHTVTRAMGKHAYRASGKPRPVLYKWPSCLLSLA